jgi:hypothetical protein
MGFRYMNTHFILCVYIHITRFILHMNKCEQLKINDFNMNES